MFSLYSHPGKLLKDHLYNVYQLGMQKYYSKELNFANLKQISRMAEIVLISHDFGKANKFFQRKLKLKEMGKVDCKEYKELTQQGKNRSNHSLLSAVFTFYLAEKLIKDELLPLIAMVIVLCHHGNLKDFKDMLMVSDWELLKLQFDTVNLKELHQILKLTKLDANITGLSFKEIKEQLTSRSYRRKLFRMKKILNDEENYLILNFIYSLLISSDKAEAIFYNKGLSYNKLESMVLERRNLKADAVQLYKKSKGWLKPTTEINRLRNQINEDVLRNINQLNLERDRILSINVPTGTGKTLTSLSAGLCLRNRVGQKFRIIYTLPFTSIIDQNYGDYQEVFKKADEDIDSSLLIRHHYLTPRSYIKMSDFQEIYDDEEYEVSKHLIESWNSEIVVTTFVQLLHSIFSNRNQSLIKFNNIANSIILLDEIQTVPYKYWELIRVIFKKIATRLNCYFIFITATMPLIYNETKGEITELARSKEEYFNFFDRFKLDLSHYRQTMTLENFKGFISAELNKYQNQNILIILNTIKSSIEVFNYLFDEIDQDEDEVIYLSTNITPGEREERINKIGEGTKRQIIVSTQMVEAGVDIDLNRVYRDFSPLDSIIQSCGRCNRNNDPRRKGTVILIKLINEKDHDRPFASYVYGDIIRLKTEKLLSELPDKIDEKNLFAVSKEYFRLINEAKGDRISSSLLEYIRGLKYETAFYDNEKGEIFQLIEQDYDTVNLFIELNNDATGVWRKYQEINEMTIKNPEDYNKRKALFEKIKNGFLDYVITVPKHVAQKQLDDEQIIHKFNFISSVQVEDVYNKYTGFKRDNLEVCSFY